MSIAFVILHYLALENTIDCVESILRNEEWKGCNIVLVDNASPDGSGKELLKYYKKDGL